MLIVSFVVGGDRRHAVLAGFGEGTGGGGPLSLLLGLGLILPNLAVGARRLHDIDRTACWLLLGLVPVVGFLVPLFFYVRRGTPGSNRFGVSTT